MSPDNPQWLLSQENPLMGLTQKSCTTFGLHQLIFLAIGDRDPHCNTHRVKEEINIRLHSNNINRDSRIESPVA